MSSSATNTFTKRRSSPVSSKRRSAKPGCAASSAFERLGDGAAPRPATSDAPPERLRSCVGMRTVTPSAGHGLLDVERGVERVERRRDRRGRAARRRDRLERLQPVAGDVDDDALVGADHAVGRELLQRRDRHAARGLGEDPLGAGEQPHPVDDLVVGDRREAAAARAHRVEREVAVGRVADRERLGDRVGLHRPDRVGLLDERGRDRRAPERLRARHAHVRLLVEQADLVQLLEALVDLREQRTARRPARRRDRASASRAARRSRTRASSSPRRRTAAC